MEKQKLLSKDVNIILDNVLDIGMEDNFKKRLDLYHDLMKLMFDEYTDFSDHFERSDVA